MGLLAKVVSFSGASWNGANFSGASLNGGNLNGVSLSIGLVAGCVMVQPAIDQSAMAQAAPPRIDQTETCEILIIGGGTAGTAAAYEGLLAGRTVCLTEITDWVGGQFTSQGVSALDEAKKQRELRFFPRGYNELRQRVQQKYNTLNPGGCWVSVSCFLPKDGVELIEAMLADAAQRGGGKLRWFPQTVVKHLAYNREGNLITEVTAIQHQNAPGTPPLNTFPLSQIIEDAYDYQDSKQLKKRIIRLIPQNGNTANSGSVGKPPKTPWLVIDATETGEIIALGNVPYRLGLDPRDARNPSSPTTSGDPYCTQGFTYTFALEKTATPQPQQKPPFYDKYAPYYGSDPKPNLADFDGIFTYRRIWSPAPRARERNRFGSTVGQPGEISMQNWVWGNDYRPGTAQDNLIYTQDQLAATGQLAPHGWRGGLRTETLRHGEEIALGFYYWLVAGTTDSQQPNKKWKVPMPNHRLLTGFDSPMGTMHGLSKYPYIRESRRIIGRPSYGYRQGFSMDEIDVSRANYRDDAYKKNLSPQMYQDLWRALGGVNLPRVLADGTPPAEIPRRNRSTIYPDSVGIAQYYLDFHPCMQYSPPEKPGNRARDGVRLGHSPAYPGQIPLRAMIPQRLDNLLVSGKNIAYSFGVAAGYRVHSFEWSVGAAAGTTAAFALEENILPYELVTSVVPTISPDLRRLQERLTANQNPVAFPDTSIFNENWDDWKIW